MARRIELKGVCNNFLLSFVSRYNDLEGYWVLGALQTHFQTGGLGPITFDLLNDNFDDDKTFYDETSLYYSSAFHGHLQALNLPIEWIARAYITVQGNSLDNINCKMRVITDLNRKFQSEIDVWVASAES